MQTIVVVGGGFSGALFAIQMSSASPTDRVLLVEKERRPGRGIAYGACSPEHLLNVPVSRMELGLQPSFVDWLRTERDKGSYADPLADAFVSRILFGDYLEAQLRRAASADTGCGLTLIRGEAVAMLDAPDHGVRLWDGREIRADKVVLAIGNLPPRTLAAFDPISEDGALFAPDPWARDALDGLESDGGVLLIGTGLTTVDVVLRLRNSGHRGPILAVSRRGLLPRRHQSGGSWPPFLKAASARSPVHVMALIRREVARAEAVGVPWQRVMDAARPAIANIWHAWRLDERRRFLRHARTYWDIHRHRMAPTIADQIEALLAKGQLSVEAGKIVRVAIDNGRAAVAIRRPHGGEVCIQAARVVNCTGPRTDYDFLGTPLIADIRRRGLLRADPLGLGLETSSCALIDRAHQVSDRIFALGPLTRSSWWEVTAVPEIKVQVEQFVAELMAMPVAPTRHLAEAFHDIGAGI